MYNWTPGNGIPPIWKDEAVVLLATGPSLTQENVDLAMEYQKANKVKIIGCNDSYHMCSTTNIQYAADARWWAVHYEHVIKKGYDKLVGAGTTALNEFNMNKQCSSGNRAMPIFTIPGASRYQLSHDPKIIHWGGNSGYQCYNIAILLGCTKIFLLGYDLGFIDEEKKRHFFGEHPPGLVVTNPNSYPRWAQAYSHKDDLQWLKDNDIKVYNCSLKSNMQAFPKMEFKEALNREFKRI